MKKTTIFTFTFIFSIMILCYSFQGKVKTQTLTLENFIVLATANAEGVPGTEVDCNSNWNDCFFGCVTKYRCNVLTPCQEIMAKISAGQDGKCIIQ